MFYMSLAFILGGYLAASLTLPIILYTGIGDIVLNLVGSTLPIHAWGLVGGAVAAFVYYSYGIRLFMRADDRRRMMYTWKVNSAQTQMNAEQLTLLKALAAKEGIEFSDQGSTVNPYSRPIPKVPSWLQVALTWGALIMTTLMTSIVFALGFQAAFPFMIGIFGVVFYLLYQRWGYMAWAVFWVILGLILYLQQYTNLYGRIAMKEAGKGSYLLVDSFTSYLFGRTSWNNFLGQVFDVSSREVFIGGLYQELLMIKLSGLTLVIIGAMIIYWRVTSHIDAVVTGYNFLTSKTNKVSLAIPFLQHKKGKQSEYIPFITPLKGLTKKVLSILGIVLFVPIILVIVFMDNSTYTLLAFLAFLGIFAFAYFLLPSDKPVEVEEPVAEEVKPLPQKQEEALDKSEQGR